MIGYKLIWLLERNFEGWLLLLFTVIVKSRLFDFDQGLKSIIFRQIMQQEGSLPGREWQLASDYPQFPGVIYNPSNSIHSNALFGLFTSRSRQKLGNQYNYFMDISSQPQFLRSKEDLESQFPHLKLLLCQLEARARLADKESIKSLEVLTFMGLSLKYQPPGDQDFIWTQRQWGNTHYPRLVRVIMQCIGDKFQPSSLSDYQKRTLFFEALWEKAEESINSDRMHPEGLTELVQDQVYCLVAGFFNFGSNQRWMEAMSREQVGIKLGTPIKGPSKKTKSNQ